MLDAKAGSYFEIYIEKYLGHYSNKGTLVNFRKILQIKSEKKEKTGKENDNTKVDVKSDQGKKNW